MIYFSVRNFSTGNFQFEVFSGNIFSGGIFPGEFFQNYENLLAKYFTLSLHANSTDTTDVQGVFYFCNHTYLSTIKSTGKPKFAKKPF